MHTNLLLSFVLVLIATASADLPVFRVPANPTQAISFKAGLLTTAASGGDYIILPNAAELRILKRDASLGLFYTRWFTSLACNAVATNGEWFGCAAPDGLKVFTFDENASAFGTFLSYEGFYWNVQFLSDGTLVAANNVSVVTRARVNSNDTWDIVDETIINAGPEIQPKGVIMHLTDTSLVFVRNSVEAIFMTRNANYSWTQVDQASLESLPRYILFNIMWLNDSLIVVYGSIDAVPSAYSSLMQVHVRSNNAWNLAFATDGAGFVQPYGSIGASLLQLSNDKVLVGAPYDGLSTVGQFIGVGSILLLERSQNKPWNITAAIYNEPRDRLWGASMVKTNTDVMVWSCLISTTSPMEVMCGFSPVPLCATDAVQVTCSNKQLDSCSNTVDVNFDNLYMLAESECGVDRSTDFTFSSSGLEVSFEFSRYGVRVGSCNASISCPQVVVPNAGSPQITPSRSTDVPVASNNPSQSGPRSQVSSAALLSVSGLLAVLAII